jgi:hypothetical protein
LSAETVETNVSEKFFWPKYRKYNRQLSAETDAHEGEVNENDNDKMWFWYRNLAAEDDIQQKIAGLTGLPAAEQRKVVEELKPIIENVKNPTQKDDLKHHLAETVPELVDTTEDGKMFFWPIWTKRQLSAHVNIEKAIDDLNEMQPTEQRLVIEELKTVVDNVKNPVQRDELTHRIAEKVPELVQTTEDGKMFFWPIWTPRALSAETVDTLDVNETVETPQQGDANESDNDKMFFWPIWTPRALSAETVDTLDVNESDNSKMFFWHIWTKSAENPERALSAEAVETPQQGDANESDHDKMFFWTVRATCAETA